MTQSIMNQDEPSIDCLVGHLRKTQKPRQDDLQHLDPDKATHLGVDLSQLVLDCLNQLKLKTKKCIDEMSESYLSRLGNQFINHNEI